MKRPASPLRAALNEAMRGAVVPPGLRAGTLRLRVDNDQGALVDDVWLLLGARGELLDDDDERTADATVYLTPGQATALLTSAGVAQDLRVAGDAALLHTLARALSPSSLLGLRLPKR